MLRLQKAYEGCSGKRKLHFILLCSCFTILISLILIFASRNYSVASTIEHGQWYKSFDLNTSTAHESGDWTPSQDVPQHTFRNIEYLKQLLQERIAIPTDALKINYRSPCKQHRHDKFPCIHEDCVSLADQPLEKRLQDLVLSTKFQLSDDHLALIHAIVSKVPEHDIIIASASSSNHFSELQAMFEVLHRTVYPALNNFHVVLFDIGLKDRQRRLTEKFCKCQVLSFPFELFDPHVSELHCYGWKPLIIRALMSKVRKLLVYQDTSVRWTDQFLTIFQRAKVYGQQVVGFPRDARIPVNTFLQMFDYMNEDRCAYTAYSEILGGVHVMHKDPLIVQAVLNPWARCALEKSCVCPVKDPRTIINCRENVTAFYSRCHRFDQSAISIILSKLYALDRYRIMTPEYSRHEPKYIAVARGDATRDYFKKERKPDV